MWKGRISIMDVRALGVGIGVVVGLILAIVIFKFANKDGKIKTEYDERQEKIRGKAYKLAFWTLGVLLMAVTYISMIMPFEVPTYILTFGSFVIAGSVLAIYCIVNGAYWGLNNNKLRYIVVFAVTGIINIALAVAAFVNQTIVVDGEIQPIALNLMCGIMLVVVGIAIALDNRRNKIESEE